MATIKDVAQACGVSAMTVSYVFNDKPGAVGIATRERVLAAARRLNYQPNRLARGLGRGKSDTLGLVIPDWHNPFFVDLSGCMERLAGEAGYQVLLQTPQSPQGRLSGWPLDGLLVWTRLNETRLNAELASFLGEQSVPIVYWGEVRSGGARSDGATEAVGPDYYAASRVAAEFAAARRYVRVAYLGFHYQADFRLQPRFAAWDDVCREAGSRLEALWTPQDGQASTFREQCRTIGQELAARPALRRPRVVACENDVAAVSVMHGLRRGGLRVPEDVAVIGFDGIEEGQMLDKPLTTVQVPIEEMGRSALEILLARIENPGGTAPRRSVVTTRFLAGETA